MTKKPNETKYTFADLFSGIGGFHLALHNAGAKCVFACEKDKFARKTYEANFRQMSPEVFEGNFAEDITSVNPKRIPDFDILCAGFPCQAFSIAGKRKGFADPRGTLFFEIVRILAAKRPKAFFLENVRGLLSHDKGRTFATIRHSLEALGYSFNFKVVRACEFGLPQYRPRVFMIGFRDKGVRFDFPAQIPLRTTMSDIFGAPCGREIGYTLLTGGRGGHVGQPRNWDAYMVDGKERHLGIREAKKMMGFPDAFLMPVSNTQAMKQLGNAVAVPAIGAVAERLLEVLGKEKPLW